MFRALTLRKPSFSFNQGFSTAVSVENIFKKHSEGDQILVKGWIKSIRKQKENTFIDLTDGSSNQKLQVFIKEQLKNTNLTYGASISINGTLSKSPKGSLELVAKELEVLGGCNVTEGFPFVPRKHYTNEYIRQFLNFRSRTNKFASLLRVRSEANLAIHNYFNQEGYVNVNTPILTSNDCEGAGEVFKILPESRNILNSMKKKGQSEDEIYFSNKVFLTVSGQLHLEAVAHGLSKVYSLGPTFRAENTRSRLHLSEFYMLEAEIAFIDKLTELIQSIEKLVKTISKTLLDKCEEDILACQETDQKDFSWIEKPFPILTYQEAVKLLENSKGEYKEEFLEADGFAKEHEIFLVNKLGGVPVFIINWPKDMKSFYMKQSSEDPSKVEALDLLAPGVGEIVGGSLRENDYNILKEKLPKGSSLDWYLDLRKFGGVPTAGYGLGFERYLQFLLGIGNIKDTIPFPRWPHNCNL